MSKGDVSAIRPETVLRGHKDAVNCLAFLSADMLSSGSLDGVLKLWSMSSRRAVTTINAHAGSVLSVNVLLHSSSILSCGRDGVTNLWQIDCESPTVHSPVLSLRTGSKHFCNSSCDRGYLAGEGDSSVWQSNTGERCLQILIIKPPYLLSVSNYSLSLRPQYGGNSLCRGVRGTCTDR